jgi:uncharacterized membrane protein
MLASYWRMFVGTLGWLDTPLASNAYLIFAGLFCALAAILLPRHRNHFLSSGSLSLTFAAISSFILLYLIELVMWTPHPATIVQGVQGRYFYPTFILFGFSIFGRPLKDKERSLAFCVALAMVALSVATAVPRLLHRYWIT